MNRRKIFGLAAITTLGLALLPGSSFAQQKSLKEQLVGTWILVEAVDINSDGSKSNSWGPNPKGTYMFDGSGHFAQMLIQSDLPKITSRTQGTPEQNKSVAGGLVAMYGTYSVNE